MNKYIFLNIVFLVNLFGVVEANLFDQRTAEKKLKELLYQKSIQARVISHTFSDKELAVRYVKNTEFYGNKPGRMLDRDSLIDLAVYPLVDNFVGRGMSKVTAVAYVYGATKYIAPSNIKFVSNNAQLITSAGITKLISIEARKGLSKIDTNDFKNFGKSCAAQVGCDAVDEFIMKPAVKMIVGDENSWTGSALRGVGNYVLAQWVMNKVANN